MKSAVSWQSGRLVEFSVLFIIAACINLLESVK